MLCPSLLFSVVVSSRILHKNNYIVSIKLAKILQDKSFNHTVLIHCSNSLYIVASMICNSLKLYCWYRQIIGHRHWRHPVSCLVVIAHVKLLYIIVSAIEPSEIPMLGLRKQS